MLGVLCLLLLVAAGLGAWGWTRYQHFADAPLASGPVEESVRIERGDGFATVLRRLRSAGVDAGHDLEWRLLARQMDAAGRIKVGEYALAADLTPRQLLQRLRCCLGCCLCRCLSCCRRLSLGCCICLCLNSCRLCGYSICCCYRLICISCRCCCHKCVINIHISCCYTD